MRLVEFLIQLLEAHAQTLQRLAAIFGEETLFQMLENRIEDEPGPPPSSRGSEWIRPPLSATTPPYAELESSVKEFKLSAPLEFHLWAYPHYRNYIEGSHDLNSRLPGAGSDQGLILVNEAVAQAQNWVRSLPIPPEFAKQAERVAQVPWLRFRANVLKRIGRRPLGPVY